MFPFMTPADRSSLSGGRTRRCLRPDLVGQYTVIATIVTTSSGSTNVTKTITAGTYMGVNTCALCHSGGIVATNKYTPWQNTAHAHIFTEGINGELGTYRSSCLACHTVGYNANTNAIVNPVNGGFDDVAKQLGWTFPTVMAPTNWAYMQAVYPSLANLANIQCENCHGPGQPARLLARKHQFDQQDARFRRLQPMPRRPDPPHQGRRMGQFPARGGGGGDRGELRALSHGPGLRELHGWSAGDGNTLRGDHLRCLSRAA